MMSDPKSGSSFPRLIEKTPDHFLKVRMMVRTLRGRLLLTVGLLALAALTAVALAVRQGARTEFRHFRDVERRAASMSGVHRGREICPAHRWTLLRGRFARRGRGRAGPGVTLLFVTLVVGAASGRLGLGQPRDRCPRRRSSGLLTRSASRPRSTRDPPEPYCAQVAAAGHHHAPPSTAPAPGSTSCHFPRRRATPARSFWACSIGGWLSPPPVWRCWRWRSRGWRGDRPADGAAPGGSRPWPRRFHAPRRGSRRRRSGRPRAGVQRHGRRARGSQALRRGLVHDVAHELRTPLTALRCRIETVVDGLSTDPARALADVRDEVLHLGRLVDDLQELALAEARELRLDVTDVALETSVDSALRAAGLEDDGRVRRELAAAVMVRADSVAAAADTVEPADQRRPPHAGRRDADRARAPRGRPCPRRGGEHRQHGRRGAVRATLRPFLPHRSVGQRGTGGVGLGLAIVRHLVEAQGGRVSATSDGTGVTFCVTLASVS